jgi:hypothetical protein
LEAGEEHLPDPVLSNKIQLFLSLKTTSNKLKPSQASHFFHAFKGIAEEF